MTKNELEAIRQLPEAYIQDGTMVSEVSGYVVAIRPDQPGICWRPLAGWKPMVFEVSDAEVASSSLRK